MRDEIFVSICVCTYRRPELLGRLLYKLGSQSIPLNNGMIEIVVVDNDPDQSAEMVLKSWTPPAGFILLKLHVAEPNISLARNSAIAAASGTWLALIDDDEMPAADWLNCLFSAQKAFSADAVFAPVVPRFAEMTPVWLVKGGFFDRLRFATGTAIDDKNARSGNVLIRAASLGALKGPFDTRFGNTGGEDTILFRELLDRGARFIWCDEAVVVEDVPPARATVRWLLLRSYRTGQIWIRAELHRLNGVKRWQRGGWLCLRAAFQAVVALVLAICIAVFSITQSFVWLRKAFSQIGKLTGLTPFKIREYGQRRK